MRGMKDQALNSTRLRAGLTSVEAQIRLERHGPNMLAMKPPERLWRRFIEQFRSPLIYILLFALNGLRNCSINRRQDRKSTRLNSSHSSISYAVFCLKKKSSPQYSTS